MAVKPSTTVLKALRLLEALKEAGGPITAREAADRTKTDRATAYRLLMTFVEAGYVTHDEETKRFEMGFKLVSLAHSLLQEDQKIESIRDVMRQVSLQSTEACHYSILEGSESVITLRERGKQLVTVDFEVGSRSDLYCTAGGKAILAFQDTRYLQDYLRHERRPLTARTVVSADGLKSDLMQIRRTGCAVDDEEFMLGLRCIAAPIFEADGSVRSTLAMSGPANRYTDSRIEELGEILRQGARELSRRRGGEYWI